MRSRFHKDIPKTSGPSQAEVRRAKDFWTDVFEDTITAQIDDSSPGHAIAGEIVRFAGEVADEALKAMETRWGKI